MYVCRPAFAQPTRAGRIRYSRPMHAHWSTVYHLRLAPGLAILLQHFFWQTVGPAARSTGPRGAETANQCKLHLRKEWATSNMASGACSEQSTA